MRRTKTYTVEYNSYNVGDFITSTSRRCSLERGEIYKVTACSEPKYAGDDCVVFVEGREHGLSTEYTRDCRPEEVERGYVFYLDQEVVSISTIEAPMPIPPGTRGVIHLPGGYDVNGRWWEVAFDYGNLEVVSVREHQMKAA